ncbi:hypothetical protein HYT25_04750 [Candidatus Pacearchaeota archaeon]|nr:hypothetical protein [Candidatus Pacearchaeota archaeon]
MKGGVIFVGLFLVLVLGVSVFVSAGFFDNFKATGKTVWEITEPTGICGGESGTNSDGALSFDQNCVGYDSSTTCESVSGCEWETTFTEFMDNPLHVNQGWNLVWGIYFPSQISSGINPEELKAIYWTNPVTKGYTLGWSSGEGPNLQTGEFGTGFDVGYLEGYSLSSSSNLNWVYFNESGDIKFRLPEGISSGINELDTEGISMISGWNFLGIFPFLFKDITGAVQNSFTLNDINGNCNIEKAYFFGGGPDDPSTIGEWVEVGVSDEVSNSNMYRIMVVKVTGDCILGKTNHQKTCIDTDGLLRKTIKGTVTIKDSNLAILDTAEDVCENAGDSDNPNRKILQEKYCKYGANGDVSIGALSFYETIGNQQSNCAGTDCTVTKEICSDGKITITNEPIPYEDTPFYTP